MIKQCAWCKKLMGRTKGKIMNPAFSITHGICPKCLQKELAKMGLLPHEVAQKMHEILAPTSGS